MMGLHRALLVKNLSESRWLLGLSGLALFALSMISVYASHLQQQELEQLRELAETQARSMESDQTAIPTDEEINAALGRENASRLRRLASRLRNLETPKFEIPPPAEIEIRFWQTPGVLLPFILWAIARGSIAVAGEIERGTLDLVMSRPVSRFDYLAVQVSSFLVGMLILLTLLVGGNLVGSSVFPTTPPTTLAQLLKASANLAALTWTIYGLTLMCSCYDLVRWRPNLIAASFTLVSSVTAALAQIRSLKEFKPYLENTSIFSAYDPLDAVKEAEYLGNSLVILGGLGTLFVALAFVLFLHRDLPSNS